MNAQVWTQRHSAFHAGLGAELLYGGQLSAVFADVSAIAKVLEKTDEHELQTSHMQVSKLKEVVLGLATSLKDWRSQMRKGATDELESVALKAMTTVTHAWVKMGASVVADVSVALQHWAVYCDLLRVMGEQVWP